jgi:aspartokinase/homoserine dehydrogenase 2
MTAHNTALVNVNKKQSETTKKVFDDSNSPNQAIPNNLTKHAIKVHKFGGSSLATAECIKRVVGIIKDNCQLNDIVVVSANGKTTDSLFSLYSLFINNVVDDSDKLYSEVDLAISNISFAQ